MQSETARQGSPDPSEDTGEEATAYHGEYSDPEREIRRIFDCLLTDIDAVHRADPGSVEAQVAEMRTMREEQCQHRNAIREVNARHFKELVKIHELKEADRRLHEQNERLRKETNELHTQKQQAQEENERLRGEQQQLHDETKRLRTEEQQLSTMKQQLQEETKQLCTEELQLSTQKEMPQEEITQLQASEEHLRDEVAGLEQRISTRGSPSTEEEKELTEMVEFLNKTLNRNKSLSDEAWRYQTELERKVDLLRNKRLEPYRDAQLEHWPCDDRR